jgi:hypothetical protein
MIGTPWHLDQHHDVGRGEVERKRRYVVRHGIVARRRAMAALPVADLHTAAGTFNGTTVITREIELGKNADEYTSTATVQFYNAADQLINTVCATATATRFE